MENIKTLEQIKRPWVVAHRGYRGSYPENTLVAFEAAIGVNADMIELDILLSKDGELVVIHDKKKITNSIFRFGFFSFFQRLLTFLTLDYLF